MDAVFTTMEQIDMQGTAPYGAIAAILSASAAVSLFGGTPLSDADSTALVSSYVRKFNAMDDEHYTNAIPNSAAEPFLIENIPVLSCPDSEIEQTYYFRWWTFRKHLRHDMGMWTISEFLPPVGWAGSGNTIVCPAGHHLREGRWLRDPRFVAENARFWLSDARARHRWGYSSWLFTGVCGIADVTGLDALPVELLDDAVRYYERWEKGFMRRQFPQGVLPMGGDGHGGFLSIDNYEGTEISLGGSGYKPLFTSAMWSEANCIAKVARKAGRAELAQRFAAKADAVAASLRTKCWNPDVGFFTTCTTNGVKGTVRELHGYAPWYFGVPVADCRPDWTQLSDPLGFSAKIGLTFPERRAPGFTISYTGHECQWNGPSWPFATTIALTGFSNWLHDGGNGAADAGQRDQFCSLLHQYAAQHRRTVRAADGSETTVPWIDENLNPDRPDWIARTMLLRRNDGKGCEPRERGKDYNHSAFCDIVISGLAGFIPNGATGFSVDPIVPSDWKRFSLERLRYRGHEISIRWNVGDGLSVSVDGKVRATRPDIGRLSITL